jgi:hypothetical protein
MKTAMQELLQILESKILPCDDDNSYVYGMNVAHANLIYNIKNGFLEKEKEQIKTAFASGWNWNSDPEKYYQETYVQKEDKTFKQKSKWTSVDNTKQHIIDIMKADEDDGLYKTFDTDPDKKH